MKKKRGAFNAVELASLISLITYQI